MQKLIVLVFVLFVACTKAPEPPTSAPAAAVSNAPINTAGSGTIKGSVIYEKAVPPAKAISMSADPNCAKVSGKKVTFSEIEVGPSKGLANAFVYIKEGAPKSAAPATAVTLDQKGCIYHPHVLGVQTGQPIKILNSDPTLHNVHAMPKANAGFNVGMSTVGQSVEKTFTKPEVMIRIKCDVHGWMNMYVGVLDHPFFAVTDADGSFEFKGLGPGQYMVEVWHEKLGTQTGTATVVAEQAETNMDFKF